MIIPSVLQKLRERNQPIYLVRCPGFTMANDRGELFDCYPYREYFASLDDAAQHFIDASYVRAGIGASMPVLEEVSPFAAPDYGML